MQKGAKLVLILRILSIVHLRRPNASRLHDSYYAMEMFTASIPHHTFYRLALTIP